MPFFIGRLLRHTGQFYEDEADGKVCFLYTKTGYWTPNHLHEGPLVDFGGLPVVNH